MVKRSHKLLSCVLLLPSLFLFSLIQWHWRAIFSFVSAFPAREETKRQKHSITCECVLCMFVLSFKPVHVHVHVEQRQSASNRAGEKVIYKHTRAQVVSTVSKSKSYYILTIYHLPWGMHPNQLFRRPSKSLLLHPSTKQLYTRYDEHRRPWPVYYRASSKRSINKINSQLHSRSNITLSESEHSRRCLLYRLLPKVVTILFVVLCATGFMFQAWTIGAIYFDYKTTSTVDIEMPDVLEPPDVSLCVRYADILIDESLRSFDKLKGKEKIKALRVLQDKVTLADIFNKTPETGKVIKECLHRTPGSYDVKQTTSNEGCMKVFTVDKYYAQEFMCYRFSQISSEENEKFLYGKLAFSIIYGSLFYALVLDKEQMDGAEFCKIVIHGRLTFPYDSIAYPSTFSRTITENEKYNSFRSTYNKIMIKFLPYPYVTNCRNYETFQHSRRYCFNECTKNLSLTSFGKVPFSGIEVEPMPVQHISVLDLTNYSVTSELEKITSQCRSLCQESSCVDVHYLSTILKEETSVGFDGITVNILAPASPSTKVEHREFMSLTELIIYISSCVGTWFGLSFFSLNPSDLVGKVIIWIVKRKKVKEWSN